MGQSKPRMASLTKRSSTGSEFSVDGEDRTAISNHSKVSIKLDVMTSKQFNRLTFLNMGILLYTFIHVIFISTACRTIWLKSVRTKGINGEALTLQHCNAPRWYLGMLYVVDIIARSCLILFAIIFAIRIIRTKIVRSNEQVWTVIMIVMTGLSYNPLIPINILHDRIIHAKGQTSWWIFMYSWFYPFLKVNRSISLSISSVGQLFYLWACSHRFGILEEKDCPSNIRFYGPKLLILTIYNIYRLILANKLRVGPSRLPGTTGIAMFVHFKYLRAWENDVFLKVMVLIVIELLIMIAILRRMCITARVLREAQYVKYRGKQIGFRYFVM